MAAIARMARSYDVSPLPVTGFASPLKAIAPTKQRDRVEFRA